MSGDIGMGSGVSASTGDGFVTLRWGAESGQVTPDECRQLALGLLATAEAAESDAAVFAAMRVDLVVDVDTAVQFIASLRGHRGKSAGGV